MQVKAWICTTHSLGLSEIPVDKCMSAFVIMQCSCPAFWHRGYCKHALGYCFATHTIEIPPDRNATVIGNAPKRGRPKKAPGGSAWQRDA